MKPKLPQSACPRCGYQIDAATKLDDESAVPTPGDVSVCMKCAHVTKFGYDLSLVELTQDELVDLATDSDFLGYYSKIQSAIEHIGQQPYEHGGKAL